MKTRRFRIMVVLTLALLLTAVPLAVAAPGDLDPSFDEDGMVDTVLGSGWAEKMALDSEGRIILAGGAGPPGEQKLSVARLSDNGSLDTTFDGDGRLITDRSVGMPIAGVAVDRHDRIILGGRGFWYLARYLSDGSIDVTFEAPPALSGDYRQATDVSVDGGGNVVVAGGVFTNTIGDFVVMRWLANGLLDTGFGGDGIVITDLHPGHYDDRAHAIAVDGTGRVVVAGTMEGSREQMAVVRYTLNGSLDPTFGSDGKAVLDFTGYSGQNAMDVTLDDLGRVVLAGFVGGYRAGDFAVVRLNPNGSLDTSFGGGDGMETTDLGGASDIGYAVAVDVLGHIVVAGSTGDYPYQDFALARYNPDGSLDSTFGGGDGKVVTDFAGGGDQAWAAVVDHSGRILAAGTACGASICDVGVARYLGDPVTPPAHSIYLPLVLR